MRLGIILFTTMLYCLLTTSATAKDSAQPSLSPAQLINKLKQTLPQGSEFSLVIEPINTKLKAKRLHYRHHYFAPPASTQKLLVALAATLSLKPTFTFNTTLSKIKRDLVLSFSGDPSLTRQHIRQLFSTHDLFPNKVFRGDIWLDGSIFSGYEKASGWPWDNTGVCYSAPASSITLDRNCVQGSVYANAKVGAPIRVHIPEFQPIKVSSSAIIISKTTWLDHPCKFELTPYSNNTFSLTGCLVQRKGAFPMKFAIQNTAEYTKTAIRQELKSLGIRWYGKIHLGKPQGSAKKIAIHRSAPLPVLIKSMLKHSDNLIADNLTKTLGYYFFQQPGTFMNGVVAIKRILKKKGLDVSHTIMEDGSGLSRSNRATAHQFAQVIRYIIQHDKTLQLIDALPIAGVDGTLKYRRSMNKAPFKGNIKAKTGSVLGSHNLVGTLTDKKGNQYLFVEFISNYHKLNKSSNKSYLDFERTLLSYIYN